MTFTEDVSAQQTGSLAFLARRLGVAPAQREEMLSPVRSELGGQGAAAEGVDRHTAGVGPRVAFVRGPRRRARRRRSWSDRPPP